MEKDGETEASGKKSARGRKKKKKDGYSPSEMQKMLLSPQTRQGLRITGKIICVQIEHTSIWVNICVYVLYSLTVFVYC